MHRIKYGQLVATVPGTWRFGSFVEYVELIGNKAKVRRREGNNGVNIQI